MRALRPVVPGPVAREGAIGQDPEGHKRKHRDGEQDQAHSVMVSSVSMFSM